MQHRHLFQHHWYMTLIFSFSHQVSISIYRIIICNKKEIYSTICICKNTSDIIHRIYPSQNAKVLFLFDDVIGRFSVNEDAMESWEQYSQDNFNLSDNNLQ
jgi:hypothetical protein